jgi:hypothetical protein
LKLRRNLKRKSVFVNNYYIILCIYNIMSKNIKGKNLDININITQAGTMNADIFNAYQDFTLNGVSIVNRIATNEGDIALLNSEVITLQSEIDTNETDIATNTSDILDLQTDKQDVLTFDSTPTAGSTNPVTSQGIKTYVDGSTPSITATAPINYSGGVISGTFDNAPTNGSVNFLSSDKVFDALALKQDEITSSTSLTTANITANGNIIGLGSLAGASVLVSGEIRTTAGDITATAGTITAPTIIQGTTNLLNEINTKQDTLTFDTAPTAGSTNPVTSQGIKTYVDNSTPTITANLPLDYSSATGVIRGIFDSVPTNSSINFLNSNVIYDALQLKQDEITSSTNLTTGNITANGNITASGGLSGASALISGLVSGANLEATALVSGASLQLNNSAGNQIICSGTGNCIFSDVLCGDITSSGSITTTTGQIGTTSGSISSSSGDIITSTGDITAPAGTISAGTISATGASGTITAPIIIQGTTNLLNEINNKQDLITSTTSLTTADITANGNITASSLSTTGSLLMTGGSSQISNAGAYNGTGNIITSGNIIGTDFITNSGTNLLTKINTKQDLITASTALTCGSVSTTAITGNPVISCGVVNCNANITTASNITCGGDLSAIGTGNNIDLRNNLVAGGSNITLTQTGNITSISNSALPISNDVLGRSIFRYGLGGFNVTQVFSSLWTSFVTPSAADATLSRSYIVKESGSQLSVTFDVACYEISGFGTDEYLSRLRYRYYNGLTWTSWAVCSSEGRDRWRNGEYRGMGLFPITTSITTNSSMVGNPVQFEAQAGQGGGDDTFNLLIRGQNDNVFSFEVTESRLYNGTPSNSYTNLSTDVTLGSLTADISPNLNAGSNISISTTSGISTISSSLEYLIMVNTTDLTMTGTGASTYSFVFNNTKTTSSNINYNALTQEFSFNSNGTYLISFNCNVFNTGHNGRVVGRTRVVKNGSYVVGDGVSYFYIRDDNYGNRETCSLSNCPIFITNFSTDKIKLNFTCNKDANGGFNSNLTGLLQAEGCLVSFVKIA